MNYQTDFKENDRENQKNILTDNFGREQTCKNKHLKCNNLKSYLQKMLLKCSLQYLHYRSLSKQRFRREQVQPVRIQHFIFLADASIPRFC